MFYRKLEILVWLPNFDCQMKSTILCVERPILFLREFISDCRYNGNVNKILYQTINFISSS